MSKGQTYEHERVEFADAGTGAEIVQLTSFPTVSVCLPYVSPCFTPDSRRLIFVSQRQAARDAPWDLFRVDVDGSDLTQLTETEGIAPCGLTPDGAAALFTRGSSLWRVEMDTCRETEVARADGFVLSGLGHPWPDGRHLFVCARRSNGADGLLRLDLAGGAPLFVPGAEGVSVTLHSCSPGGAGLLAIRTGPAGMSYALLDADLRERALFTSGFDFAHCTFLGRSDRLQGCGLPPLRAILTLAPGEGDPRPLAEGPYFWHSASSLCGEWIVADTNWPDEGIQLVHVPTGRARPLCRPGSSEGHPQRTHPHPRFSPDGRVALYNSDRTGITQIYTVRVTDEARERLRAGDLRRTDRTFAR
ncbi:MAG: PD40 domain-containing protein [Chthonomonadales bacterium]|nr:PD40 domain-containing protein [Chthonomonadales bacterium]